MQLSGFGDEMEQMDYVGVGTIYGHYLRDFTKLLSTSYFIYNNYISMTIEIEGCLCTLDDITVSKKDGART